MNNIINESRIKLTNRELMVIKLVCQEFNNKEIGDKMYLSKNSIKLCLEKLYKKLNVRNRVQLAVFAVKHKLF